MLVDRMRRKFSDNRGFTLVEISIVFIIFSFIFVPLITILARRDTAEKQVEARYANDRAVAALSFFLKQNGRYPCPADPTLSATDPAGLYGREEISLGACTVPLVAGAGGNMRVGVLPTRALDLPFHASVNNNSWKYLYVVSEDLTQVGTFDAIGDVRIWDDAGLTRDVPFLIIDPGKDGKGARSLFGVAGPACTGAARDVANCDGTFQFLDIALSRDATGPLDANFYDDILSYSQVDEKNDLWIMRQNAGGSGQVELSNRSLGRVGIGIDAPMRRLHVSDGDMVVRGGVVDIAPDLEVMGTLNASTISVENQGGFIQSDSFCTGAVCP